MPAKLANQQFILDANVLIDGIFNPFSYSFKVINHIKERDIGGYILDQTIDEVHKIILEARDKTGINLTEDFGRALDNIPLTKTPPVTADEISKYVHLGGEGDGAVAAAAERDNLVVCTHDDDFYKGNTVGIEIMDPLLTVLAARNYEMGLYVNLPGFLCTPQEGSIYIEAITGWGDFARSTQLTGVWDVLDAPGIGVVYLDLNKGDLTFSIDDGPTASVTLKDIPPGEQLLKIVVSYNADVGVAIYRGHGKPRAKHLCKWTTPNNNPIGPVTYFHGRNGAFGASKSIRTIAGFHKYIPEKGANNMLKGTQPLIPSERFALVDLIGTLYSS
jgi:predicted nucleic acid-binding protein